MFKAAKTWSFLESWLDGLLICSNINAIFCGNLTFKYNTSQGRSTSAFSYMYFDFISRFRKIQQRDLYKRSLRLLFLRCLKH